jgi:hypothetical protein
MAKKSDLMGLGLPVFLARRMADEPSTAYASGATLASATQLGGDQYLVVVTSASGTNASVALPAVGGDTGCLLGDSFTINNQYTAGILIFAQTGTSLSIAGAITSGSTGISVTAHTAVTFYPITATSWIGVKGS